MQPTKKGDCSRLIHFRYIDANNWTQIPGSAGIYYDHVHNVNFIENHWKLVTYVDIDIFDNKLDLVKLTFKNTKDFCNNDVFKNTFQFVNLA